MNKRNVLWGSFIASVLAVGCSGGINVGNGGNAGTGAITETAGAPSSAGSGSGGGVPTTPVTVLPAPACTVDTPLATWPSASDCHADSTLTIAGTWHGKLDNAPAPFDDLTLVIKGRDSTGNVCGTFTMGNDTPPPPATDPNVGYPDPDPSFTSDPQPVTLISGAPLSLLKPSLVGSRLSFYYAPNEARRSWCELQHSYQGVADKCSCIPPWGSSLNPGDCVLLASDTNVNYEVNCGQVLLCGESFCACNANGCDATQELGSLIDLTFDGSNAAGTTPGGRILLTRAN